MSTAGKVTLGVVGTVVTVAAAYAAATYWMDVVRDRSNDDEEGDPL